MPLFQAGVILRRHFTFQEIHQDYVRSSDWRLILTPNAQCPATHPVKIPQLFYEVIWDTSAFNNPADWPADGSQPFVWSFGDKSGYGNHGDYVFGWKGDALQKAMDSNCYINCPQLQTQTIQQGNQCSVKDIIGETIDGCKFNSNAWSRLDLVLHAIVYMVLTFWGCRAYRASRWYACGQIAY